MPYGYCNQLRDDNGETLAEFSGHWPVCAALIRMHNPDFVSTGGDKGRDLHIERLSGNECLINQSLRSL